MSAQPIPLLSFPQHLQDFFKAFSALFHSVQNRLFILFGLLYSSQFITLRFRLDQLLQLGFLRLYFLSPRIKPEKKERRSKSAAVQT